MEGGAGQRSNEPVPMGRDARSCAACFAGHRRSLGADLAGGARLRLGRQEGGDVNGGDGGHDYSSSLGAGPQSPPCKIEMAETCPPSPPSPPPSRWGLSVRGSSQGLARPLAEDAPHFPIRHSTCIVSGRGHGERPVFRTRHLHDLRHVVASHLLNKGVPYQMRAEVLGHSPGRHFATTARYSHVTIDYLRRVYEELDDLAPELWNKPSLPRAIPTPVP